MKTIFKNRVYFLILLVQIIVLQGCNLTAQTNKLKTHKYAIINLELDYVTNNSNSTLLDKDFTNNLKDLLESLKYDEKSAKKHFLTTKYKLDLADFKLLFSDTQLEFYKSQLLDNNYLNADFIENSKIGLTTKKEYQAYKSYDNIKHLIVLSNVVFTTNNEFALLHYYDGNTLLNSGNEILAIYKFNNGEWQLFRRITLAIL